MLRHFRINDPYRLITLLILLSLASLPFLTDLTGPTLQEIKDMVIGEGIHNQIMYSEIIDHSAPMTALFDGVISLISGRSLLTRHILALLIIICQATYFGVFLINNKAYNESNYLPSLIFGFLCLYSFDLLSVTPELMASGFLLLVINGLFREIEFREERDSITLNIGVYAGLASLFVFSYTVFLFGSIAILMLFARASFRKISLVLFGYSIVHAGLIMLYYCFERTDELWSHFYLPNLTVSSTQLISWQSMLTLGIMPIAYFVFSFFMLTREARFTRYQSQLLQVMLLWMVTAAIQILITPQFTPHSFLTFIPPLSYLISHYLLLINRKWIAELMLWIFILGLPAIGYLAQIGQLKRVDYSALFPKESSLSVTGKKLMVLDNDLSAYRNNSLGGYFLNWELSRKYFEEPDYYENITKINQAFLDNPPDVIVDPLGRMRQIEERIPALKLKYRKEDSIYLLR